MPAALANDVWKRAYASANHWNAVHEGLDGSDSERLNARRKAEDGSAAQPLFHSRKRKAAHDFDPWMSHGRIAAGDDETSVTLALRELLECGHQRGTAFALPVNADKEDEPIPKTVIVEDDRTSGDIAADRHGHGAIRRDLVVFHQGLFDVAPHDEIQRGVVVNGALALDPRWSKKSRRVEAGVSEIGQVWSV